MDLLNVPLEAGDLGPVLIPLELVLHLHGGYLIVFGHRIAQGVIVARYSTDCARKANLATATDWTGNAHGARADGPTTLCVSRREAGVEINATLQLAVLEGDWRDVSKLATLLAHVVDQLDHARIVHWLICAVMRAKLRLAAVGGSEQGCGRRTVNRHLI